jgi:Cytochrome c bacterial/Cytochrome c7 and related cytochrome c
MLTVWEKHTVKSIVRVAILLMLVWVASASLASANTCKGDFDGDGDVDESDLAIFFVGFGRTDCSGDCDGDFDIDGDVDGSELAVFSTDFDRTDCNVALQGSHADRFATFEGTETCLSCHQAEALEVHDSVHYQWLGDASETIGLNTSKAGKLGGINDFCIYPDINWIGKLTNTAGNLVDGGCAKCHAGLGAKPTAQSTAEQLANIDCLICHSDAYKRKVDMIDGVYKFVPDLAKMTVGINQAAADITLPSKDSCLNCHTKAGGGDNFKRGDIEEAHRNPSRSFDVHMAAKSNGGAGLSCLDCHTATQHKIAGRGSDLRPRELQAEVSCNRCHADTPHDSNDINKHTARVNCTVCHIPHFAKVAPTDMNRDWSKAGEFLPEKGLYEPSHVKGTYVTPVYRFFNGMSQFYQFGDTAEPGPDGRIVMSAPIGDILDEGAKIFAFKKHLATQPIQTQERRLLPLKIGKFFMTGQIDEAVKLGATAVGWDQNGDVNYEFAGTERYMGLFHEVAPKEEALNCNSCHNGGTRLDFAALGYTPKETNNGKRLCVSCHEDESNKWSQSQFFTRVHDRHVDNEGYDCSRCHTFTKAN